MTDRERMNTWHTFLRAHATLIGTLERELQAERGLPITWYDVLYNLSRGPDSGLRMQALADAVLLSRSGVTRIIDRMIQAGLVERTACEVDRRGVCVVLTAEGRRTLRRAAPVHRRGIQEHFAEQLDDVDIRCLQLALDKVLAAAERRRAGAAQTSAG